MKIYENVFTTGQWGEDLWVRLYDTDTKKPEYKKFSNKQFVPPVYTLDPITPLLQTSKYRTFDTNKILYKNDFKNISEQKSFIKSNNKKMLYGSQDRRFHYIRETYPDSEACNHEMRTNFVDIEVEVTERGFPKPENANQQVTVIQMYDTFTKEYYILGIRPWTGTYESTFGKVTYIQLQNEVELLNTYIQIIQKTDPAIITGFNSNSFDLPYLITRMRNLGIDYEQLSPVGEVLFENQISKDGFSYRGVVIKGRILTDYKDLVIKYAFLDVPTYSLENVAIGYKLQGKSKQKSYTYQSFNGHYSGEGWVKLIENRDEVPEDELEIYDLQSKKQEIGLTEDEQAHLSQLVFDTFMRYAIRDVEVMLEIDQKAKLINLAKTIAYISGVTMDDVTGTLKFWLESMYKTAYTDNVILPMEQQFTEDCVFIAGWVRAIPGKYKWATSFDIGSAHPHEYVNHNIGADTLINPRDLHPELRELKEKYFNFYTSEVYGKLADQYNARGENPNDMEEETDYILFLLKNAKNIRPILEKYNVIATVNGYFYTKEKEGYSSKVMREGLDLRLQYKAEGKNLRGEIEKLKGEKADKSLINEKIEKAEYAESMSLAFKIRINAYYGASALSSNPFSNGKVTGACVAMSTRAVNKISALAVDRAINKFLGKPQDDKLSHIKVCDTDSIYAMLESLVAKVNPPDPVEFCKKFSTEILKPEILKLEKEFLDGLNVVDAGMMKFDNEIIAETLITTTLKRYFAKVLVQDGVTLDKPKSKAVGISLISKSTPKGVKDILKPTLDMFMDKDERYIIDYLAAEHIKFNELTPQEISGVVGVSNLSYEPYSDRFAVQSWKMADKFKAWNDETGKFLTAPLNSSGALVHNELIKENGLQGKYELIDESNKVNVIYLQVPNPITFKHKAIAFKEPNVLKDLGILQYIDRDIQWEKEVITKLQLIAEAIGWNIEETAPEIDEW